MLRSDIDSARECATYRVSGGGVAVVAATVRSAAIGRRRRYHPHHHVRPRGEHTHTRSPTHTRTTSRSALPLQSAFDGDRVWLRVTSRRPFSWQMEFSPRTLHQSTIGDSPTI